MEVVYFTIVAGVLYVVADTILDRFERWLGRRLRYRSLVFFGILAALAFLAFSLLREYSPT